MLGMKFFSYVRYQNFNYAQYKNFLIMLNAKIYARLKIHYS